MRALLRDGIPWAGVIAGPLSWAGNTQTGYALVPWICAHHFNLVAPVALIFALIALVGAVLSWRAWQTSGGFDRLWATEDGRPRLFLAGLGIAAGVLFALVILAQGGASLVLSGCER